jgi:hypothetical protein
MIYILIEIYGSCREERRSGGWEISSGCSVEINTKGRKSAGA